MTPLLAETVLLQIALPLVGSVMLSYGIYQVIVESRKGERKKVLDRLRGETQRAKKPRIFRSSSATTSPKTPGR
jgi:hypothetical protein